MEYSKRYIRKLTFFFLCCSIAIWALYFYFKLWEFIGAAISLKYINVQTVSFVLYSFLLVLLPVAALYVPKYGNRKIFTYICLSLAAVILVGTIGDLFTYKFFKNYTFIVGDAVFCNILVSIPNIYGTVCCLFLSLFYFLLGKYITRSKIVTCILYLLIIAIEVAPPLLYSFNTWGGYPRHSWIEKAVFILSHQGCLLLSFILSTISDFLREREEDIIED